MALLLRDPPAEKLDLNTSTFALRAQGPPAYFLLGSGIWLQLRQQPDLLQVSQQHKQNWLRSHQIWVRTGRGGWDPFSSYHGKRRHRKHQVSPRKKAAPTPFADCFLWHLWISPPASSQGERISTALQSLSESTRSSQLVAASASNNMLFQATNSFAWPMLRTSPRIVLYLCGGSKSHREK